MTETPNPYRPPLPEQEQHSVWSRLVRLFQRASSLQGREFSKGRAVLFEGISYFVDPDCSTVLYAASPTRDTSDKRLDLIVSESLRLLPLLIADYPALRGIVSQRRLVVRMIRQYSDSQADYIRQVEVQSERVQSVLSPETLAARAVDTHRGQSDSGGINSASAGV